MDREENVPSAIFRPFMVDSFVSEDETEIRCSGKVRQGDQSDNQGKKEDSSQKKVVFTDGGEVGFSCFREIGFPRVPFLFIFDALV